MLQLYLLLSLFSSLCFSSANAQDTVNCTLCPYANDTMGDPNARVNTGTETLTCQDIYDRGILELPVANCTTLQAFGTSLCLCGADAPTLNEDCTLCEDGAALGQPLLEGLTDETCAELEVDAQRDYANNCYAWQGTVGIYCACENNVVSSALACRICGNDTMLPDPLDTEETNGDSCGKLEFQASLPGANCSAYQEEHSDYCCRNVPTRPTPTSGGCSVKYGGVVFMISFLSIAGFLVAA